MAPIPYTPPDGHIICLAADVPDGWEFRSITGLNEWNPADRRVAPLSQLVEARPVRQPDPKGKWVSDGNNHFLGLVTTVAEMRDRTDLDQWEYADTCSNHGGGWFSWAETFWTNEFDDDFPVIVRRKQETQ